MQSWFSPSLPAYLAACLQGILNSGVEVTLAAAAESTSKEQVAKTWADFDTVHHELMKLVQWADDHSSMQEAITFMEHFKTASCNISVWLGVQTLGAGSDPGTSLQDASELPGLRASLSYFNTAGGSLATVERCLGVQKAGLAAEWCERFRGHLEKGIEVAIKAKDEKLTAACAEFTSHCAGFGMEASQAEATALRERHDALLKLRDDTVTFLSKLDLRAEDMTCIQDTATMLEQATVKSVLWGFSQLLSRKILLDKQKGKDTRERIRTLYKSRVQDDL